MAYQFRQIGHRPAELPRPYVEERILLLRRRAIIDIDTHAPVAFQDVAWDEGQDDQRVTGDIQPIDGALVDMPAEHAGTSAAIRILANPARAQGVARADLQQPPL